MVGRPFFISRNFFCFAQQFFIKKSKGKELDTKQACTVGMLIFKKLKTCTMFLDVEFYIKTHTDRQVILAF